MSNSERIKILRRIKNKEITASEGRALLEKLGTNNESDQVKKAAAGAEDSSLGYYNFKWEASELCETGTQNYGDKVIIIDDDDKIYSRLSKKASGGGMAVFACRGSGNYYKKHDESRYELDFASPNQCMELVGNLEQGKKFPQKIIYIAAEGEDIAMADTLKREFSALINLTKALMQAKKSIKIRMLYVFMSKSDEVKPQYSALAGFAKTLHGENPSYICRIAGISGEFSQEKSADIIWNELKYGKDNETEVKYNNKGRLLRNIVRYNPENAEHTPLEIRKDGTYLITGGAGGLGWILAKHLAQKQRVKLVLCGRSTENPQIRNKIKEISESGSAAVYIAADVSNPDDAKLAVGFAISEFGKINGIIHCAGVVRDSLILNKTGKQISDVFAPKVVGTVNLDRAAIRENLDFFAMYSSNSASTGNAGQSDYATANSFMEHYAHYRNALTEKGERQGRAIAVSWPLWKDGGMKFPEETVKLLKNSIGIEIMPTRQGLKAWDTAIKNCPANIIIIYGMQSKIGEYLQPGKNRDKSEGIVLPEVPDSILFKKTQNYLKEVFADLFSMPAQELDPEVCFEEYGFNSMMVNQFNARIAEAFDMLPKTLLFEYKNLNELTQYMVENQKARIIKYFKLEAQADNECAAVRINNAENSAEPPWFYEKTESEVREKYDPEKDIAIIGVSGRYPGAKNVNEFWKNLVNGRDCVTEIPKERWDLEKYYSPDRQQSKNGKMYCKWGGFIDNADKFDPLFFNIMPKEAEIMDPQERTFLETAWSAFEDAGYSKSSLNKANVGVFVGITSYTYMLLGPEEWSKGNMVTPYTSPWSVANRVSYFMNLSGPSMPIDTACSSSLTAIHQACVSLKNNECSMALAGGVNLYMHPMKYVEMCGLNMLSPTGRCHSFGAAGDGFVPGEGVGAIILKPLRKAVENRDNIYAVIKGSSVNHGGKTNGYTVPNPDAQARLISDALKRAGVNARTISCVEAHGTGTALGDPIEIAGLDKAFKKDTDEKQFCSIGSLKSNIGHLEAASGIASVTKAILQMKHRKLVPSIHSDNVNPNIDFDATPFYLQHKLSEWKRPVFPDGENLKAVPRRAGVSSFGAGGSNAHVIIEEYAAEKNTDAEEKKAEIIVLSAKNAERLKAYARNLADYLTLIQKGNCITDIYGEAPSLEEIAYTLQTGREAFEERLAVVVKDIGELKLKLEKFCTGNYDKTEIFSSNTRKYKDEVSAIAGGEEAELYVSAIAKSGNYTKLAKMWALGVNIAWNLLYDGRRAARVSLPTYPFEGKRYWVETKDDNKNTAAAVKLHPLIDSNASTFLEQSYTKIFSGREYFIEDHMKLLPAAVYIEMIYAAGNMAGGGHRVSGMSNIVFISPAIFSGAEREFHINIRRESENIVFNIVSEGKSEAAHVQGTLEYDSGAQYGQDRLQININAVKGRCGSGVNRAEEYYGSMLKLGTQLGPRFKGMKEFFCNDSEALSRIELDGIHKKDEKLFSLHPVLIDGGLQTVNALASMTIPGVKPNNVPYVVGGIKIFTEHPRPCYVYAKKTGGGAQQSAYNIYYLDKNGDTEICLSDYSIRPVPVAAAENLSESAVTGAAEILYYTERFRESALSDDNSKTGALENLLIFSLDPECLKSFSNTLTGSKMVLAVPGEKLRRVSDNIYEINPKAIDDYTGLLKELLNNGFTPENIIHLWSGTPFEENGGGLARQLDYGYYSAFYLTKALLSQNIRHVRFLYAYNTYMGTIQPQYASLSGFGKTAAIENLGFLYKTVGLETYKEKGGGLSTSAAQTLIYELLSMNKRETDVLYEKNLRYVKSLEEFDARSESEIPLKRGGVYIITGGMGALGRIFARYLSKKYAAKIVLTGRSDYDGDKERVIQNLKDYGGDAFYVKCNIADREETLKMADEARKKFGRINGVIHAAGEKRDSYIVNKSKADTDSVLSAKVFGTVNLNAATAKDNPDVFILFSSTSAIMGNAGQCDYAYGCAFLNNFARLRSRLYPSSHTVSINWPYWKDGGMRMDEQVQKLIYVKTGTVPITERTGIECFEQGISSSYSQFAVTTGDINKIRMTLGAYDLSKNQQAAGGQVQAVHPAAAADELISQKFRADVKKLICGIMKIGENEIDFNDSMGEFGFDSISFTELSNAINHKFDLSITPASFYGNSTLASISTSLYEGNAEKINEYYKMEGRVNHSPAINREEAFAPAAIPFKPEKSVKKAFLPTAPVPANVINAVAEHTDEPIAVIGMGGLMPQSDTLQEFWDALAKGKSLVTEIPQNRWNWREIYGDPAREDGKTNVIWGAFMKEIDKFDPLFFNISGRDAEMMDPQERLALICAWKAMEDAGYRSADISNTDTGVFIGVATADYKELAVKSGSPAVFSQTYIANRISYTLNLHGPSEPVDTACSSSLVAVDKAVEAIRSGNCRMAFAGGVNVIASPSLYIIQSKSGMLSHDGKCKTFDAGADGYVKGEGAGCVLLKSLSQAEADGDHIYAVIIGSAVNHGGRSNSVTSPNSEAQAEVIVKAYEKAGINPEDVDYIEAHGTGTSLGDPVEIEGLKKAFAQLYKKHGGKAKRAVTGLGSVKANIGHLEAAAGISAVFKVILSMNHNMIPPLINFKKLNPYIKIDGSPFYIADKAKNWTAKMENGAAKPRIAGISSFGIGGTNAHIVLRDYRQLERQNEEGPFVFVLSAKDKNRLKEYAGEFSRYFAQYLPGTQNAETVLPADSGKSDICNDLTDIVSDVLNVEPKEIDIHCSLHDLGADVSALQSILNRVAEKFSVQIDINDIEDNLSVQAIADYLFGKSLEKNSTIVLTGVTTAKKQPSLACVAFTLQTGRDAFEERLSIVVSDIKELSEKLRAYCQDKILSGVYCGNSREEKSKYDLIIGSDAGDMFINSLIEGRDLNRLAQLWVCGVDIDWKRLYGVSMPQKISLPTYPFAKERYWIPETNSNVKPPVPPAAKVEEQAVTQEDDSLTDDEYMELLKMVEEGELTADEADLIAEECEAGSHDGSAAGGRQAGGNDAYVRTLQILRDVSYGGISTARASALLKSMEDEDEHPIK